MIVVQLLCKQEARILLLQPFLLLAAAKLCQVGTVHQSDTARCLHVASCWAVHHLQWQQHCTPAALVQPQPTAAAVHGLAEGS
jgi:hypothetical protein